jgi:hypothetical protein
VKRWVAAFAGLAVLVPLAFFVVAPAGAARIAQPTTTSTTTPPKPAEEILAIVSPIASPACGASGTATLLVPIVGGVLQTDLGLPKSVDVGNLLLDALGPVYVVCGDLPSPTNTHCSLDNQIAGVWPTSLPPEGLVPPAPVGDLVDSITNALRLLDLSPAAALESALQCQVKGGTAAPKPPDAHVLPPSSASAVQQPPSGPGLSPLSTLAAPFPSTAALPTQEPLGLPRSPAAAATPPAAGEQLVSSLRHRVPSWLLILQVLAVMVLALVLAGSWLTSARAARGGATPTS